ncbi:MAG: DUF4861 family protein [Sediminicola sp.]
MKLFPSLLTVAFLMALLTACKEKKQEATATDTTLTTTVPQIGTYAEISVREGGEWQGREYKGGTFKNVTEVTLPQKHTDHSNFLRYEGPGWENAQIGYRLYLDWRNAIDIFGKKTDTMVLAQVGKDGSPSYHDPAPWGQDILKSGNSLGIGGFGKFIKDSVAHFRNVEKTHATVSNGADASLIKIEYTGWGTGTETIDLLASLSIYSQDRFTQVTLDPSDPIDGLTTGLVKFKDVELLRKQSANSEWGYIATYGKQTLVNDRDKLGMAIFYKTADVEDIVEGPHDHLILFKKTDGPIGYYFLAAWEQEPKGITTKEAFLADLDSKLNGLQQNGNLN